MKNKTQTITVCYTLIAWLVFSLIITIFASSSHAKDGLLTPVTLQLRWLHQFQFAGYYAAIEKGYYQDAGLKVILKQGGAKIDTVREILDDHAQYGVTNSEILLHHLEGDPLVVLAVIFQHSPLVFIARQKTGISSPQDMIGRTVKMSLKSRDIELHATLRNEGIDLSQIKILEGGTTYEDYFDPAIDALSAYLTNQPQYLENKGIPYTIIKPSVYGVDFYGDSLFTSKKELTDHPERVKAFREASLKGWHYAMDHPDEIINLILAKYNPEKDRDHLAYEARIMNELILPDLVELGHMNPGRWQHIAAIFEEQGMISPGYSLEGFIYDPDPAKNITWLLVIISLLTSLTLLICIISFFLYKFNRKLRYEISERIETTKALRQSQKTISAYSRQIEQFSLSAASVLSIRDEKIIGRETSQAIIENSDYQRVLISLFTDEYPYREIIGYGGVSDETIDKIRIIELPKSWYDKVFEQGTRLGQLSYYVPHNMKHILNQDATISGTGDIPENSKTWHPEDNLFVRMNDESGNCIGIISVDNSKSGLRPTDELVRPLEIYSSLISQIIFLKREHEKRALLEEQLRQAQKMEAIGNLTGGIAHDFNNILGVIIGNAELAMLDPTDHNKSQKNFQAIKAAGIRARDIVKQLLSFSRKSVQETKPVLLQAVIEDSLTFLRSTIPTSILINHNLANEEEVIRADSTQIYQIIVNLCTNAAHAMETGGVLTVSLDRVSASETAIDQNNYPESGEFARIIISDTGQGIPAGVIHKIFDPYFTTKEIGKGTGIGLAVVHGIVKSHSGNISVSSTPGEGTTFTVLLPTTLDPIYAVNENDLHQDFVGSGRILYVDDEPSLLSIGKRMLERFGYEVETFEKPLQALGRFKDNPENFDLLVTDFTMPEMTGDILAREIMALAPNLPVILCTGFTEKIDEQQAIAIGIRKYLKKPLSMSTLARIVSDTLGSKTITNDNQDLSEGTK